MGCPKRYSTFVLNIKLGLLFAGLDHPILKVPLFAHAGKLTENIFFLNTRVFLPT